METLEYKVVGLMSGTSMDGLDISLATYMYLEPSTSWTFQLHHAACIPYPTQWLERLRSAHLLSGEALINLDRDYGHWLGTQVKKHLSLWKKNADLVSSHGHTVFHNPKLGYSFQIGYGASIAGECNIAVINDLRGADIVFGGQGAPLVPLADQALWPEFDACLNLGGIANLSFKDETGMRLAYDVIGCNLLLDRVASRKGLQYDADGTLSLKGSPDLTLLSKLQEWPFLFRDGPKSLHKEDVLEQVLPYLEDVDVKTALATLCAWIGININNALPANAKKVLVTGGGAFNQGLIKSLQSHGPDIDWHLPSPELIKFKEAVAFGFLGLLTHLGLPNTLPQVTGARRASVGGSYWQGGIT